MRKPVQARLLLLLSVLSFWLWALPQPAAGCEICKINLFLGFIPCRPVTQTEVGSTICEDKYDIFGGFSCEERGTFCSSINVGGGGGGGGTGGTGGNSNTCQTSGYCPAECFSCRGGGGRPAV